jgi:hypothetical protein
MPEEAGGYLGMGLTLSRQGRYEDAISEFKEAVSRDAILYTATVYFTLTQNAAANRTIDPSHIEFKFSGKDVYGLKINPKFDQVTGFSGVF